MTEHPSFSDSPRRATPARSLPTVVARFIATETASGVLLLVAGVVALVWANSPWGDGYRSLWHTKVLAEVGSLHLGLDLRHLVNDGLMTLFFFVVGLEIKREAVHGELSDRRVAALPVMAALGGMVVPALIFLLIGGGTDASVGWGIPVATDIAFALGVLALLGSRVPAPLKLIVLTLAIVDDIGAILVIAIFYSDRIAFDWLALAVAGIVVTLLLRRLRVDWSPAYIALAVATWFAMHESGVHATIAGVALALMTPTVPLAPVAVVTRWMDRFANRPSGQHAHELGILARESASPAEFLEARLHPTTSLFILPVFALANAGVEVHAGMLDGGVAKRVFIGVVVGLVLGKLIGIAFGAWLGVKTGVAALPAGVRGMHLLGVGALGGIGFTVSLFIAGLAYDAPGLTAAAQLGVLVASVTAALVATVVLLTTSRADAPAS